MQQDMNNFELARLDVNKTSNKKIKCPFVTHPINYFHISRPPSQKMLKTVMNGK